MSNQWQIYDDLIASVPDELVIKQIVIGPSWVAVYSATVGLAMLLPGLPAELHTDSLVGRKVKEVAQLIKSWNFKEASIGLAAINSVFNTEDQIKKLLPMGTTESQDVFVYAMSATEGKNVATIGHFPHTAEMAKRCTMTIFERNPSVGDMPDSATEYLLPQQDMVFITSSTLTNKTLPRLLQLTRQAKVFIVGPGTPLSTVLFEHGISYLSGAIVIDQQKSMQSIAEGLCVPSFVKNNSIRMVNIARV